MPWREREKLLRNTPVAAPPTHQVRAGEAPQAIPSRAAGAGRALRNFTPLRSAGNHTCTRSRPPNWTQLGEDGGVDALRATLAETEDGPRHWLVSSDDATHLQRTPAIPTSTVQSRTGLAACHRRPKRTALPARSWPQRTDHAVVIGALRLSNLAALTGPRSPQIKRPFVFLCAVRWVDRGKWQARHVSGGRCNPVQPRHHRPSRQPPPACKGQGK